MQDYAWTILQEMGHRLVANFAPSCVWGPAQVCRDHRLQTFPAAIKVHTGLKFGDHVYLKPALLHMETSVLGLVLAAKDVQGRLNKRLQHLEGGEFETGVPKYCCKDRRPSSSDVPRCR